jgi:hypothetical protein
MWLLPKDPILRIKNIDFNRFLKERQKPIAGICAIKTKENQLSPEALQRPGKEVRLATSESGFWLVFVGQHDVFPPHDCGLFAMTLQFLDAFEHFSFEAPHRVGPQVDHGGQLLKGFFPLSGDCYIGDVKGLFDGKLDAMKNGRAGYGFIVSTASTTPGKFIGAFKILFVAASLAGKARPPL